MGEKMSPDLLSDLPLGIIHKILSFVPIRDAIRTSILSRKWRFRWASLPHLVFDDKCVNPWKRRKYDRDEKRLSHFISQTLFLHEGPIHTFELRLSSMEERHCIDQWLIFLSRNQIRNLLLGLAEVYPGFKISSSLYLCQNLTHLKLHACTIPPPPPSFKGFLCLRSLDICIDEVDSSTIQSIVALSPLLERFTLCCYTNSEMTFRAPNLKYFHSKYVPAHLSLCTPLLEEFVGRFTSTKSFSFEDESFVFHHIRTIELSDVPFDNKEVTRDVIRLINGSPNLQNLKISSFGFFKSEVLELAFAPLWDSDVTYNSLKLITIDGYVNKHKLNEIGELRLVKFLLARSPVLEKVIYKPHSCFSDLELLMLTAQLLRYHRASTHAEIVISDDRFSSLL